MEVLRYFSLPTNPGVKTRSWKHGRPVGVTEHYTGGVSWFGSADWLQSRNNTKSSCHALIADRRVGEVDDLFSKYDVLEPLPVLSLLLADINEGTWHAGWANNMCFGIENRNAGILRHDDSDWYWWPNDWTTVFPVDALGKWPVNLDGQWWEPYTYGQLVANIYICQMLHCLYQTSGGLDPNWFLPHSGFSNQKMDAGRMFPLQDIREAVFEQIPTEDLTWLHAYRADPMYMDGFDEKWDEIFIEELAARQGDRDGELTDEEYEEAISAVPQDLQDLVQNGVWRKELNTVRWALNRLGYWTGDGSGEHLDPTTKLAVWQFQKSMGLKTDGIPGDKETQPALVRRLKDFKLWEDGRPWERQIS